MSRDGWLPPGVSHEDVERAAGAWDEPDSDIDPEEEERLNTQAGRNLIWCETCQTAHLPDMHEPSELAASTLGPAAGEIEPEILQALRAARVSPFPTEPAPDSPEAVEQAARALRGFTPGPWEIRNQRDDPHPEPGIMAGKYYVATCHDMAEQTGPNANLIAAAPDLLAERDRFQAEVERLRESDRVLTHAVNQRTAESRRWSSVAVERKAEIAHLREANAQLEKQRDGAVDAIEKICHLLEAAFPLLPKGSAAVPVGAGVIFDVYKVVTALRKAGR